MSAISPDHAHSALTASDASQSHQNPPEPATNTELNLPILPPTTHATTLPPNHSTTSRELSPKQLTAISLLLAGRSVSTVAAVLQLDRHTVSQWKNHHPAFKAELHRRHSEIWDTAHARLRQMLLTALDVVNRRLHDRKWNHDLDTAYKLLPILARHSTLAPPRLNDPDAIIDAQLTTDSPMANPSPGA